MVSTLDQRRSTPKLPSIHQLTSRTIERISMSPKVNQLQVPQQFPVPSVQLATPLPPPLLAFQQSYTSTPTQPSYPIALSHIQQLHPLRLPVNRQYIFTQNSPASPISPILSPYFTTQQGGQGYSPPTYPVSYTSPSTSYYSNNPQYPVQQLSSPYVQPKIPVGVSQQSRSSDTSKTSSVVKTISKIKKPGKQARRRRKKSTSNGSHTKLHTKTGSLIYNRKPRQTLVFNENSIHYPVHRDLTRLINTNKIPSSVVQQLNTTIYCQIDTKKYSTSALDSQRNFLTVFEYTVNDHWVIWDYETGFVHLTGIWKASLNVDGEAPPCASHFKADIVKLLESTPKQYQAYIKRIRGGFLKIQGTWLPFKLCKILARRFCYNIRFSLIPIFGPDFPEACLHPNDPGYGELKLDDLKNYEQGDLPEPADGENTNEGYQEQLAGTQKTMETKSTILPADHLQPLQSPILKQSANLASPVSTNSGSSKFVDVEQLPPVGTFSSPSTGPTASGQETEHGRLQQANSYERQSCLPLTSTTFLKSLDQHGSTSTSSESLNSVFTQKSPTQLTAQSKAQSYSDLLEIVNASKCLQLLRQEQGNTKILLSPLERSSSSHSGKLVAWEDETDDEVDDMTSKIRSTKQINHKLDDGISSILIAAELNKSFAYSSDLRSSMSIKDLST